MGRCRRRPGEGLLGLLQAGERGPAAGAVREDFPDAELLRGGGHDGQLYYAIARAPMHPDDHREHLDRPRYRLQRPLYPWAAWALHPTGGGPGLVVALFVVGVAGVLLGGAAMGAISSMFRGPPWLAAAFPLLPGTYAALRISTADGLAVALALTSIALSLRGRRWAAVLAAVASVLAREPTVVTLVGFALWRRDRDGALMVAVPCAAAGALWLGLRAAVADHGAGVIEFTAPFRGLAVGVSRWASGFDLLALAGVALAIAFGVAVLVTRGRRSPFFWVIALHLAMTAVLAPNVVALNFNATRATLPLLACAFLALVDQARSSTIRAPGPHRAAPPTSPATR